MDSKGFTLVELSIVLIIIGLLIGGVLKGQELIANAEIVRAASNLKSMESAIQTFRSQYGGFPGDLGNASKVLKPTAIDGNWDSRIDTAEAPPAFQHLTMADLIDGTYNNETGESGEWVPGKTVPRGPSQGSGYWFAFVSNHYSYTGNIIEYARSAGGYIMGSVLTPRGAQSLDRKLDDGFATTGALIGLTGVENYTGGAPHRCTTSNSQSNDSSDPAGSADYLLTETADACRVMLKTVN